MKLILITFLFLFACNTTSKEPEKDPRTTDQNWNEDSFKNRLRNAKTTNHDFTSPIKILSAIIHDDAAIFKYKNAGKKAIDVARIEFRVTDAFGETPNSKFNFTIDNLAPGQTGTVSIHIPIKNSRKILEPEVLQIAFNDGTRW